MNHITRTLLENNWDTILKLNDYIDYLEQTLLDNEIEYDEEMYGKPTPEPTE